VQPFIDAKRGEIAELCRTHHVRRLSVFGSAVRDDFDPEKSDIDVIVEFEDLPGEEYLKNKYSLLDKLATRFERRIDLLTWKSVRNPYLLKAILRSNVTLYGA